MSATTLSAANTTASGRGALVLLLLGVALLVFGTNLQGVLLPLRGHERGAGMAAIGLLSSSWSAGFVVACASVGSLLGIVGHNRAFAILATVSAAAALSFPLLPHDAAWIALRFLGGFCFGGASAIVECRLLEHGTAGIAFAGYMIANLLASLCGTLSLDVVDPAGALPFGLAAAALAASALPVSLSGASRTLRPPAAFRPRLLVLCRTAPDAVAGCLIAGTVISGFDMRRTTLMLAANAVGGAIAYAPATLVSARLDRRLVLGALALAGALVCAPLMLFAPTLGRAPVIGLLVLFGLVQCPLYGLAIGLASAGAGERDKGEIASEALLLFGTGAIMGPLLGAAAMRHAPQDLFLLIAALLLTLTAVSGRSGLRPEPRQEPEAPGSASVPGKPSQVFDEEVGCFQGGEVAAVRHDRPA